MFVTGAAVIVFSLTGRRSHRGHRQRTVMSHDLSYFLVAYALRHGGQLLPRPRTSSDALAGALIVVYGHYVYETLKGEGDLEGEIKAALLPRGHPGLPHAGASSLQMLVALAGIVAGRPVLRRPDAQGSRRPRRQPAASSRC